MFQALGHLPKWRPLRCTPPTVLLRLMGRQVLGLLRLLHSVGHSGRSRERRTRAVVAKKQPTPAPILTRRRRARLMPGGVPLSRWLPKG